MFDTISDLDNVIGAGREFSAYTNAAKSLVASRIYKFLPNTTEEMNLRDGCRFEQTVTRNPSGYDVSKEAMIALTENQPPVFTGR